MTLEARTPTYNFKRFKTGTTWLFALRILDDNGAVRDITGYNVKMQIRDRPGGAVHATLSTDNGAITVSGTLGQIIVTQTPAQTAAYTFRKAEYDMMITSPDDTATCILQGEVVAEQRITQ